MLKFNTSCAVLAYLSSNLLNEVGLSLFRYFAVGLRVCDIVVKKLTFAISSPDEFLLRLWQDAIGCRPLQVASSTNGITHESCRQFFVSVYCTVSHFFLLIQSGPFNGIVSQYCVHRSSKTSSSVIATHLLSLLSTKPAVSFPSFSSQRRQVVFLHSFWVSSFHSST